LFGAIYSKLQPHLYKELMGLDSNIEYTHRIPSDLDQMFDRTTENIIMDEARVKMKKSHNYLHVDGMTTCELYF